MTHLGLLLAVTVAAILPPPAHAGDPEPGYADTLHAGVFSAPTAIAFLPDGRLVIAEQGGPLKLFDGAVTTLGTIPVCAAVEMGLLGIAIDPAFGSNGFIYLYRTKPGTPGVCDNTGRVNEIVRVTMSGLSIGSLTVLLSNIGTDGGNHNGGVLRYNPDDGKLYAGVGDTGNGDNQGCPGTSTNPYAQDLDRLEGKVLRLNLDGTAPADNPFFGQGANREKLFAYGFRNPFRFSFDPTTGRLWLGDVGDFAFEEIDIVTSGDNYAFPHCEGLQPTGCQQAGDVAPIFVYSHGGPCPGEGSVPALGTAITGGAFAGAAFGTQAGTYVFGDFTASNIYLATLNGPRTDIVGTPATIVTNSAGPVDVVPGPDGAIYYVAINSGQVRRLAAGPPAPDQLLGGKRLVLKTNTNPERKRVMARSTDPAINLANGNGSADDPTLNAGSLRVVTTNCGGDCDDTYTLPNNPPDEGWSYIGQPGENKGYKFKSKIGPIRVVKVRAGKLVRAAGRGSLLGHQLPADPEPVSVVVQTGGRRYCMEFGGTTEFTANSKFIAKDAAPPATCPP